ncbi:unnamed protein product [Pedinophyceae sp. YPF-701]|nr:unnamed protein product [Pedinophyceae sp. YPF-701]
MDGDFDSVAAVLESSALVSEIVRRTDARTAALCREVCRDWKAAVDSMPDQFWEDVFKADLGECAEASERARWRALCPGIAWPPDGGWKEVLSAYNDSNGWPMLALEQATHVFLRRARRWRLRAVLRGPGGTVLKDDVVEPSRPPLLYAQSAWAHFYLPDWVAAVPSDHDGVAQWCRDHVGDAYRRDAATAAADNADGEGPSTPAVPRVEVSVHVDVWSALPGPSRDPGEDLPWPEDPHLTSVIVIRDLDFHFPRTDDDLIQMSHRTGLYAWDQDPGEPPPSFAPPDSGNGDSPSHHIVAYMHHEALLPAAARTARRIDCARPGAARHLAWLPREAAAPTMPLAPTPKLLGDFTFYCVVDVNRIDGSHLARIEASLHTSSLSRAAFSRESAHLQMHGFAFNAAPVLATVAAAGRLSAVRSGAPIVLMEPPEGGTGAAGADVPLRGWRGTCQPREVARRVQELLEDESMVDISLYDAMGGLLLGRSGVEVWQMQGGESDRFVMYFLAASTDEWSERCALQLSVAQPPPTDPHASGLANDFVQLILQMPFRAWQAAHKERTEVIKGIDADPD